MSNAAVCLATLLGFVAVSGCRQSVTNGEHADQDSHSDMVEHIAKEHGIRIGPGTNADSVVEQSGNMVAIAFTPAIIKRLPPDCLPVLHFDAPKKVFTAEQYDKFLDDFHDYLLLTYGEGRGPTP